MSPFIWEEIKMDFDYFKLRSYLETKNNETIHPFKLAEVADLFYCSTKNVKRKIQNYEKEGALSYTAGRGRGHLSTIIFSKEFADDMLYFLENQPKEQKLSSIVTFLESDLPAYVISFLTEEFRDLFNTQTHEDNQDILRMMMRRQVNTLEPKHVSTSFEAFLLRHLSDTLVTFNKETQKVEPWLAHHFSANHEKTCWTFYLRKSVTFHNGQHLDSKDVLWSISRAQEEDSVLQHFLQHIKHIEILSPYILRVHLMKPDPFFIRYLSAVNLPILPKNIPFDEKKWVSTGPFQIQQFSQTKIVLKAFDNYFMPRALLDKIEFWYVEGAEKLDSVRFLYEEEKPNDAYVEQRSKSFGVSAVCFNFNKKDSIIQHKAFREAIFHLIDSALIQVPKERQASTYFQSKKNKIIPKKPKQIPLLLKKMGYDKRIVYMGFFNRPSVKQNAIIFQKKAEELGIKLELVPINLATDYYSTAFQKLDFIWLDEEPGADLELGYFEFFTNPNLIPRRFLSEAILLTVADFMEEIRFGETYFDREKSRMSLDTWLTENFFLFYVAYSYKMHHMDPQIRGLEDMMYGYYNLRKIWVPLSDHLSNSHNKTD